MPVFISHRSADNVAAKKVHDLLVTLGVKCYLDDIDEELRTTDDIASVILRQLGACSHLLAVVSQATTTSWWVPFEIGVGTATDVRITSYKVGYVTLPQYLSKWPVLSTETQLIQYASLYQQDGKVLLEKGQLLESQRATVRKADDFHRALKRALGQT
jgi:hypothetical protein